MKDFTNVKKAIENLPASKQELAKKLVSKLEFMDVELEKLQGILKEKGWVEEYQNGATQFGLKKSSEGEVYNTLIKSYNSTIKQLNDMITQAITDEEPDELMQFLKGRVVTR